MANLTNSTPDPLFIGTTFEPVFNTTTNFSNFTTNFTTTTRFSKTTTADVGGALHDKCYTSNTNIIAAIL